MWNGHVQDATEETQQLVMALKANVWEQARSLLDPMPNIFSRCFGKDSRNAERWHSHTHKQSR